jgi:hypothetical protein
VKFHPTQLLLVTILFSLLLACRDEGERLENQPPDTQFSIDSINVSGDNRLTTIVQLSWYGKDPDGYVKGFEVSTDQINWNYTTSQDSTFQFSIDPLQGSNGQDSVVTEADIDLYVRSIDNEGLRDPSPSYLKIPIQNTPPVVEFSDNLIIPDTAFLVATTEWSATDLDGDETINGLFLSINGKGWHPISRSQRIFSLVPQDFSAIDTTEALIYIGSRTNPESQTIPGLVLNDTNRLYIKAVDQSGAESMIDTSEVFFMKSKNNDVLVVGGIPAADNAYRNILRSSAVNLSYDFLNLTASNGIYRPAIWDITFRLQLSFYDKLFFYSDQTTFVNNYTNLQLLLLEFAAASLQEYANSGGKYLISTSFNWNTNIEIFRGILPIQEVSTRNYGLARLYQDSIVAKYKDSTYQIADTIMGQPTNIRDTTVKVIDHDFPVLGSSRFALQNVGVFNIDSNDTEVLYEAQLSEGARTNEWPDTKIVGSARRLNGNINQVFFSIQLFQLDADQAKLEALFDKIFNDEFN